MWGQTNRAATNDDPIDISAAGKRPVFLHYVEPTSIGLVMYSTNEQFLLTTDSETESHLTLTGVALQSPPAQHDWEAARDTVLSCPVPPQISECWCCSALKMSFILNRNLTSDYEYLSHISR